MNKEAQRIAIAEACGWTGIRMSRRWEFSDDPCCAADWSGLCPNTEGWEHLPDYLNDLNAMHESEKVLRNERNTGYFQPGGFGHYRGLLMSTLGHADSCIHATAGQRAEAFLRTLNKWGDSK